MNKRNLFLIACIVSGDIAMIKAFQKDLPGLSLCHGETPQIDNMSMLGESGYCGVLGNKLIPLHHL